MVIQINRSRLDFIGPGRYRYKVAGDSANECSMLDARTPSLDLLYVKVSKEQVFLLLLVLNTRIPHGISRVGFWVASGGLDQWRILLIGWCLSTCLWCKYFYFLTVLNRASLVGFGQCAVLCN